MNQLGWHGAITGSPKAADVVQQDTLSSAQNDTISHLNILRGKLAQIRDCIAGPVPEKAVDCCPSQTGAVHTALATRSTVQELVVLADDIVRNL